MTDLTDEQIRDAFLVGAHTPPQRPDQAERLRAFGGPPPAEYFKRAPAERPLSAKWYMIMTMQLRGLTQAEISKRIGCSQQTVSNICTTDKYRRTLEARMKDLDIDLITLKPKAIEALSNALTDQNRDTALRAARTYFEMTGQGTFGKGPAADASGVSAVGLAKALVAEARAEVHVHVGEKHTVQIEAPSTEVPE